MLSALNPKQKLGLFALIFSVSAVIAWGLGDKSFFDYWGTVWGVAAALCWLLARHRVTHCLWKAVPSLNTWVAPDLNGTYRLETTSNWNVHQTRLAALKEGNTDKAANTYGDLEEGFQVGGSLVVKHSVFGITASYTPDEKLSSRSGSEVVGSYLRRGENGAGFILGYVYVATTYHAKSTDAENYKGAAEIRIEDPDNRDVLFGEYWTNRSWRKALNTAGRAKLIRAGSS